MDFKNQIKQLGERVVKLKDSLWTEEATKNAFIMPFIQILGYDVFNPLEVVPEFISDIWIKKWEKIDEVLISNSEVNNTYILEEVDAYFIDTLLIENKNNKKVNFTEYSTKTNYFEDDLNEDKFREYIKSLF